MSNIFRCENMEHCFNREVCDGQDCGGYKPEPADYCCMCGEIHQETVGCDYTEEELLRHEEAMVKAREAREMAKATTKPYEVEITVKLRKY